MLARFTLCGFWISQFDMSASAGFGWSYVTSLPCVHQSSPVKSGSGCQHIYLLVMGYDMSLTIHRRLPRSSRQAEVVPAPCREGPEGVESLQAGDIDAKGKVAVAHL